jgi:hypothetical protein
MRLSHMPENNEQVLESHFRDDMAPVPTRV